MARTLRLQIFQNESISCKIIFFSVVVDYVHYAFLLNGKNVLQFEVKDLSQVCSRNRHCCYFFLN